MNAHRLDHVSGLVLQRVRSDFLEMRGPRLTCRQTRRLWALDEQTCTQILEFLVDAKFLWRSCQGMYSRLMDGYSAWPRPQMAKARLDEITLRKAGEAA